MTLPVRVHTLGAGSDVGRSCFIISIMDTSIMVDAGVHLKPETKAERVPLLPPEIKISAAFITHYHLDHIGALPYLTEVAKTLPDCDIYMTHPTKALSTSVLVDYSKGPNGDLYCTNHALECINSDRITTFSCGEEIRLRTNSDFVINTAYAGHVVGGVLLIFKYQGVSVVYTGDFSVMPDSLLRPIAVPPYLIPRQGVDVVITESTHCTTVTPKNKSQSAIEHEIFRRIQRALNRGGRVLIPLFAVGRTQEFASMIRRNMGSHVRLFTTSPGGHRASLVSESICRSWLRDSEDFQGLYGVEFLKEGEPVPDQAVVFASPAMIEGGSSLKLFMSMCEDERNLVIITGYCNKETVGNSVILFASRNVADRRVNVHGKEVRINCECFYSPFSGHTDSNGILQVLTELKPRHAVVLVHGHRENMERFRNRLTTVILPPTVQVDIPENYQVIEYDIDVSEPAESQEMTVCSVRRRFECRSAREIAEICGLIADNMKTVSITGKSVNSLDLSDTADRSVHVEIDTSSIVFTWAADISMGPHWITFNPLVDRLLRILKMRDQRIDQFSVSDISDQ